MARENAGFTQESLAEKIEVSRTAVARWESNDSKPSLENLVRLAVTLNVSTDWLLSVEHNPADVLSDLPEQALILLRQFIKLIQG